MKKDPSMNPHKIVFVLNGMERPGGLGTPVNIFLGRATRTLEPNFQNKFNNIRKCIELRKQKAIAEYKKKGKRFNRDSFDVGDEVVIQCPFSKEWKKKGIIEKARFIDGG